MFLRAIRSPLLRIALLVPLLPLCACGSVLTEGTADAAGLAGAGIAGAVSKNATVGAAIGIGVQSVASTGLHYVERRVHRAEQDRIASVAGGLPVGEVGVWHIEHDIPIENDEHGQVVVSRTLGAPGMTCKEIVFSVDVGTKEKPAQAFYTATVCLDGQQWKWATAEPATTRWGSIQ